MEKCGTDRKCGTLAVANLFLTYFLASVCSSSLSSHLNRCYGTQRPSQALTTCYQVCAWNLGNALNILKML